MFSGRIFLIGLPGAGKTTLGQRIANKLGITFYDLDFKISQVEESSIAEIFEQKGEEHFRGLEKKYLEEIIEENQNFVLSTGGGTPCFFDNMKTMNLNGVTVYINTPIEVIEERLKNDTTRPLMKKLSLSELKSKREEWYNQAQHTISDYVELEKLFL